MVRCPMCSAALHKSVRIRAWNVNCTHIHNNELPIAGQQFIALSISFIQAVVLLANCHFITPPALLQSDHPLASCLEDICQCILYNIACVGNICPCHWLSNQQLVDGYSFLRNLEESSTWRPAISLEEELVLWFYNWTLRKSIWSQPVQFLTLLLKRAI